MDGERREPAHSSRRRRRRIEFGLAIALVLVLLVIATWRLDPAALGMGPTSAGAAEPPHWQGLSKAGDVWLIPDSKPYVVNFTSPSSGTIWMNLTVSGGDVSVWDCPASTAIHAMGYPPCDQDGTFGTYHGALGEWRNATVYAAELAFINYGPSSDSGATVTLMWASPLAVVGH